MTRVHSHTHAHCTLTRTASTVQLLSGLRSVCVMAAAALVAATATAAGRLVVYLLPF